MAADLSFVAGVLFLGLAILRLLSARAEGTGVRGAAALGVIAVAMIAYAEYLTGFGYGPREFPHAVVRLAAAALG